MNDPRRQPKSASSGAIIEIRAYPDGRMTAYNQTFLTSQTCRSPQEFVALMAGYQRAGDIIVFVVGE